MVGKELIALDAWFQISVSVTKTMQDVSRFAKRRYLATHVTVCRDLNSALMGMHATVRSLGRIRHKCLDFIVLSTSHCRYQ